MFSLFKTVLTTFSEFFLWLAVLALLLSGCAKPPATAPLMDLRDTKLIPREVLFGNPQRAQARISPDGTWLSFMAPVDGVLNVWVAPIDHVAQAKPVTQERMRPVPTHSWTYDGKHILYVQDKDGDEDFHVYATNVETGETRDLTPIDGVRAEIQEVSHKRPNEILVGLNDRDPQHHDIWRINLASGEKELVQRNEGVAGYLTDDDFRVRMALDYTPTGGQVWLAPEGEGDQRKWVTFAEFGPEDAMTSGPAGFDKSGQTLYYQDSRNRNTAGLFSMNLATRESKLIAEDPRCDAGGIIAHPVEKNIQAVAFTYAREEWKILDPAIQADFDYLKTVVKDADFVITSRTLDDTQWTVAYVQDNGPMKFYRYLRTPEKKAIYLFDHRDDLAGYPLVKMHDRVIKSRDGLHLVCYLSLPPGSDPDGDGVPASPVPLVLDVHGGPWARDDWGFNASHQWLTNRGYAVLSVNYRGSTGFGKEFINAADGEWSGKMHDDLLDAVNWAVNVKIAIKDKVAITGGSYGGYATLVGMTFTPDVFACGVDIVGPSSLVTLLQNVPPYWAPFMPVMKRKVGDVGTEEGRAGLLKRSPLELVDKIKKPLLIAQGANDPRVTQLEADQIVSAMKEKNIPVTYVLYPDEGHGFRRPENSKSFNAVMEAFLSAQLGGRFEPVGTDFDGAMIRVPEGAAHVPGLSDALKDPDILKEPPKAAG
jgi:dipeptidyl aminopeptidase/acylaminoacyl peptidase